MIKKWALLAAAFLLLGCGVKNLPSAMSAKNPKAPVLSAVTTAAGVEVSFTAPASSNPEQVIEQVIFHYAYLPLQDDEDPECPACPPLLKQTAVFSLTEQDGGKRFVWNNDSPPRGMKAAYRAVLVDRSGRRSPPSAIVYAYVLDLPPAPPALTVDSLPDSRLLRWRATEPPADLAEDSIAYIVQRRSTAGIETLNARPLRETVLRDYTAIPSLTYRYRVLSARLRRDSILLTGPPGPWVKSPPPGRITSLAPPVALVAVSLRNGVYLRFEPVEDPENKGYIIERREERSPWRSITAAPIEANTYIDSAVADGRRYLYRVKSIDDEGDPSPPGDEVEILYQAEEETAQ
jgi:hypothetical protein